MDNLPDGIPAERDPLPKLPQLAGLELVDAYPYADEEGRLLSAVGRYQNGDGKTFRQLRLVDGEWRWGLGGTRRVLYRLPKIREHIAANRREPIYVVEGEKDVSAVEEAGGVATTCPMGAGKWQAEYSEMLQGARRVIVVADSDETGRRHAGQVVQSLSEVGVVAEAVEAKLGKDAADHLAAGFTLDELVPLEVAAPVSAEAPTEFEVITAEQFASEEDEADDKAILGTPDQAVFPENGDAMIFGDGGAGKTTLANDGACHIAAGDDWLGIRVAGPARVLLIENEGPRKLFKRKIGRKIKGWAGQPLEGRLRIASAPWARFSFAIEAHRLWLAEYVRLHEINLVIVGPVTASGMDEAGTLQDARRFAALLQDVRDRAGCPITFCLIHHESKSGKVSGAWEGVGDTLIHVHSLGHGKTRVFFQKVRWSSDWHRKTLDLDWTDGESFTIAEKLEIDDDTIAEKILEYVSTHPGAGWTKVDKAEELKGVRHDRRRNVRDGLLASGRLVNVVKENGVETATRDIPERKAARLYAADDPAIRHLGPARGADGAQMDEQTTIAA